MRRQVIDLVSARAQLQQARRAAGEYAHGAVRLERGHLMVSAGDEEPVARLTPLGQAQDGLSFYRHAGRWEPMPFTGALSEMATTLVDTLGPSLAQAKL